MPVDGELLQGWHLCRGAGSSLKEAIRSKLMSADTCTVREGENTGNMNQVGAYAHRRGFGLVRHGELWKHCPCSALKHR